jgi:Spy/CpxP family protein refolding chaperone
VVIETAARVRHNRPERPHEDISMTDLNTPSTPAPESNSPGAPAPTSCSRGKRGSKWGRRLFFASAALLLAVPLVARAFPWGGGHGFGPPSEERMRNRVERMAERIFDEVDASDEQRTAILATLDAAIPQMAAIAAEGHALKQKMRDALVADPIDEAAIEELRGQIVALADRGSEVMSQALIAVAKNLTPAQRLAVAEHMEEMRGRFGRGHGRGPGPDGDESDAPRRGR